MWFLVCEKSLCDFAHVLRSESEPTTYFATMELERVKFKTCLCTYCRTTAVFRKKKKQQQQQISGGGAHGGCFQDLDICEINISKGIWRGRARTFLWFFTSFELRAVGRNMFLHLSPTRSPPAPQSLSHNLCRHRSPSRRPARECVFYFLCPVWWPCIYR